MRVSAHASDQACPCNVKRAEALGSLGGPLQLMDGRDSLSSRSSLSSTPQAPPSELDVDTKQAPPEDVDTKQAQPSELDVDKIAAFVKSVAGVPTSRPVPADCGLKLADAPDVGVPVLKLPADAPDVGVPTLKPADAPDVGVPVLKPVPAVAGTKSAAVQRKSGGMKVSFADGIKSPAPGTLSVESLDVSPSSSAAGSQSSSVSSVMVIEKGCAAGTVPESQASTLMEMPPPPEQRKPALQRKRALTQDFCCVIHSEVRDTSVE